MAFRILLVDDEAKVSELMKVMLEPLGCSVVTSADSREAAVELTKQEFDGVFVDVQMPHLDGFGLTKLIRTSGANARVPIVMLTALDDVETMRAGFKAGITLFLGKPFTGEKLRGLFNVLRGAMLTGRRRYARLPLGTTVNCTAGSQTLKLHSLNIGLGGMLLSHSGRLDVGQEVDLEFKLPKVTRLVKPRGRIVRKEPPDRIAVQFINVAPEDQEAIQSYVGGNAV
jgi:CheY-like chemotaxis protein